MKVKVYRYESAPPILVEVRYRTEPYTFDVPIVLSSLKGVNSKDSVMLFPAITDLQENNPFSCFAAFSIEFAGGCVGSSFEQAARQSIRQTNVRCKIRFIM